MQRGIAKLQASGRTVREGTPKKMAGAEIHGEVISDCGSETIPPLAWAPRPNGLSRDLQRALRRGAAGDLGVPPEWSMPEGLGLPQHWVRTAYTWTWRWRMTRTSQPLRLRLEAYVVCAIPTRRWGFAMMRQVRRRWQVVRMGWDEAASEAWTVSTRDGFHRKPRSFGWRGEGPALHPSEGQGGAPLAYMLRAVDLKWEVLAASHFKAWLRLDATVPLTDYDEGAWLSDSLSRREEKQEERARKRAQDSQLPAYWVALYWERFAERVREGSPP